MSFDNCGKCEFLKVMMNFAFLSCGKSSEDFVVPAETQNHNESGLIYTRFTRAPLFCGRKDTKKSDTPAPRKNNVLGVINKKAEISYPDKEVIKDVRLKYPDLLW